MNKTQLLCTFIRKADLKHVTSAIASGYNVVYSKIFVLETETKNELICSYNIQFDAPVKFIQGTISVHRKRETNTIYTINALNELIRNINNGVLDKTYPIEWENYRNMVLVTSDAGLKRIKTNMVEVITLS